MCPHRTSTNIVDFAHYDEIMQGTHSLLRWNILVETVDLQYIDVVRLKAAERLIYLKEDRLP